MPRHSTSTSFQIGHKRSQESKEKQRNTILEKMEKGEWQHFFKYVNLCNTPEANAKKSHKGENHPKWIKDRTKVKWDRSRSEERQFTKEVMAERNYTCELTGQIGGKLSLHHKKPVWKYPELRYDKGNATIIQKSIHLDFHKEYGWKADELDWVNFLKEEKYVPVSI